MAKFTIAKKDGSTESVEANSPQEAYQLVTGQPLAQGSPVPVPTPKADMPPPAPGLEGSPAMGGPTGAVMTPDQQREALLNLLPVIAGALLPMIGPEMAAGAGLSRLAPMASGVAKAGFGGAAGQAGADASRVAAGADTAPGSVGEAASRAGDAALEQGLQEVGGRVVGRVGQGVTDLARQGGNQLLGRAMPYAERVTDLGREVIDTVMREAHEFEPILTDLAKRLGLANSKDVAMKLPLARASNVTASKVLDLATRISESAPGSGFEVAVKNFGSGGSSAIVKQIADDFGQFAQPNELGQAILMSNADLVDSHKMVEGKVWNYLLGKAARVGKTGTGVRVDITPLESVAAKLRVLEDEIQGTGGSAGAGGVAKNIGEMFEASPSISFEAAKLLRSRLRGEIDRINTLVGGKAQGRGDLVKMSKLVDQEMRKALASQAPDLLPVFNTANRLTAERARELQNPLIQQLSNKVTRYTDQDIPVFEGPAGEIPATMFAGPGAAGKVDQARTAMAPQQFDEMANSWVQWKLAEHPDPSGTTSIGMKPLNGGKLREEFSADGPNGEILRALFKKRPGDLDRLRKWTDVVAASQLRPGEGGQLGTLAIMSSQWGAVGLLAHAASTGKLDLSDPTQLGAGAVILTPPLMSRFMNSPQGYQLLTWAVSPSTNAREGAKLGAKIYMQAEKFKKGLSAMERAYHDNVEMQIRSGGSAMPNGPVPQPVQPPAQPTPLSAVGL